MYSTMSQHLLLRGKRLSYPFVGTLKHYATVGELTKLHNNVDGAIYSLRHLCVSTTSASSGASQEYRNSMWKRLKKRDPEMEDFLFSSSTQTRIRELSKIMSCSIDQATELVKRDSPIGLTDGDLLYKKIKLLMSHNFTVEDIISHPSVLHRSFQVLQSRLGKIKMLNRYSTKELGMENLKKSNFQFKMFVAKCQEEDKLRTKYPTMQHYLVSSLNVDDKKAKKMIEEYQINSSSILMLKNKIDLLQSFNVPSDVIKDLLKSVSNTSLQVMKDRLNYLLDHNLMPYLTLKRSWLIYCNQLDFVESTNGLLKNVNSLESCKDKEEYLVMRLKCSKKVAQDLVNNKRLTSMSELKLKSMLDFFLDEMRASPDFVISNVHLMGYSLERFRTRWPRVKAKAKMSQIPHLFVMSDDKFNKGW